MTDLQTHIFKTYFPYAVFFILGLLVGWRGCKNEPKRETVTIEKPVPVKEYVDRWRTDTVRFVRKEVITVHDTIYKHSIFERLDKKINGSNTVIDTIYQRETVERLDTLFLIDTVKIVETWLTELNRYDTTVTFDNSYFTLRWQNYQNLTENLTIDYTPKKVPLKWALGVHANAGLISDFQTRYTPLFGLGLQATIKNSYIAADYGFNGNHYIGVRYGRNIISR